MIKEAMSSDHIINVWDRTYKERLFDPHNKVVISGIVEEELEFNYRQKSTKINFYKTVVASIESSGRVNKIMIALSETIKNNMPIDVVAIFLKEILENLGNITGDFVTEDIINDIFSKFCLGK